MENNRIILQPNYVESFKCDGFKCNAKCCGNWRIDIDMESYKKYQRIKNPAMRRKILSCMEPGTVNQGFQIKLGEDGFCPLLCEDKLCYIQRNRGADALSLTCQHYPRNAHNIGKFQIRTLSMSCPVAAEMALFTDDGMQLQEREDKKVTGIWSLPIGIKSVPDDLTAVHVIMGGFSILQNTSYSMEQRLVLLGMFMDRVQDCQQDAEAVLELIGYYNSEKFRQEIAELWENWQFYQAAHKQFMAGIFKVLNEENKLASLVPFLSISRNYDKFYDDKHELIAKELGTVLEHYWQQEWLFSAFPFAVEGSYLHNYFAYLIAYKILQVYIYGIYKSSEVWDKDVILDKLGRFSKMIDHERNFMEILVKETKVFESEPLKLMQVLLKLN